VDYLWTPWRYRYVAEAGKDDPCIFCAALAANDDAGRWIVHRGRLNFIILNLYPYTTGHSMIVPYKHVPDLAGCDAETLAELMQLAQRLQMILARIYRPEGFNLGMNLGRCAGAGVTGHVHMHVLPRWSGDSSFMTTVAETRLHPEDLDQTYAKLRREFSAPPP
jgi:ATP adenylyltransferase